MIHPDLIGGNRMLRFALEEMNHLIASEHLSRSRPRWKRDRYRDLGRLKQRVLWRVTSAVFAL
jgi:hypothetical protein